MTETFLWDLYFLNLYQSFFHFQLLNFCKLFYPKRIVPYGGVGVGVGAGVGAGDGPGDGAGVGCVVGGPTPPPLCAAALSATIKATIVGAV